jgi:hypothetical protein
VASSHSRLLLFATSLSVSLYVRLHTATFAATTTHSSFDENEIGRL